MSRDAEGVCPLCDKERRLTFHHLICRSLHSNKWFKKNYTREQMQQGVHLCRPCHTAVHRAIPDRKEMSREYNTLETLLEHPEVARYAAWARSRTD